MADGRQEVVLEILTYAGDLPPLEELSNNPAEVKLNTRVKWKATFVGA